MFSWWAAWPRLHCSNRPGVGAWRYTNGLLRNEAVRRLRSVGNAWSATGKNMLSAQRDASRCKREVSCSQSEICRFRTTVAHDPGCKL